MMKKNIQIKLNGTIYLNYGNSRQGFLWYGKQNLNMQKVH